jgi:hypothetical protein
MQLFTHFAYLDAGTGSLIIQSLIGITAGVAVFGRRAIGRAGRRARAMFGKQRSEAEDK